MLWLGQRILMSYIKFIVINIVQEHIDTAKVVGGNVDFLPEEALTNSVFSKYFRSFQQQRTATAKPDRIPC